MTKATVKFHLFSSLTGMVKSSRRLRNRKKNSMLHFKEHIMHYQEGKSSKFPDVMLVMQCSGTESNWAGKVPGVRGILVITVDNVVIRQWRRGQD